MSAKTIKKESKVGSDQIKSKNSGTSFPFTRENYRIMFIGMAVILLGYLLMVGGKSPDPNQFYPDQVYSWRRITLAPIIIVLGFVVEVYAIMKKPKEKDKSTQP